MIGFLQSPKTEGEGGAAEEEEKEDLKTQPSSDSKKPSIPNEPLDLWLPELEDISLSFSDCILDFDYINGCYTEGIPELSGVSNMTDLGGNPVDFPSVEGVLGGAPKEIFEVGLDGICVKEEVVKKEEISVVERSVGSMGCQKINENEGCLIEEEMGKVSLDGNSGGVNENVKNENDSDSEEDSDDESSSSTSSSSSSSSSSDDDDEGDEEEDEEESVGTSGERKAKNVKKHMEMEEGEILLSDVDADEMVGWSDNEDDDDVGSGMIGPITSKNELKVLPPVPPVNVTLQPHHQTIPVGVILSILGAQVIVEGVEKHNPLNDGSILWITELRSPLGIVDEIFGPVKNPYYVVRYNSEIEVPTGIQQGTLISFVQEFSDHILNEKSLYQKGYDASGENDEELSEQLEFSDDEKEAEYKRSLKMKKRGKNDSKSKAGPKRKEKWQQRNNNNNSNDNQTGDKLPVIEEQTCVPPLNQENHSGSSGLRQDFPSFGPPTGIWSNNNNNLFPHQQHHQQQQQSLGLPPNGMLWMQQQNQNPTPFQLYQTPLQTSAPPLNFNPLAGQPNFGAGPTWLPPPTIDQNMLYSLQFGMAGLPGQHPAMQQSQGSQIGHSLHAPTVTLESPPNFNQGRGGGRGGGYHRGRDRGRGRSSGMRGRY